MLTVTKNTENSRPESLIGINPSGVSETWNNIVSSLYEFDVIIRVPSGSCAVDMWLFPDRTDTNDFQKGIDTITVTGADSYKLADGDSSETMTIPGTASGVITAGSFMGRGTWTDINGNVHDQTSYDPAIGAEGGTVGQASVFSSLGPTGDGRQKPDVSAPGEPIISTKAKDVSWPDTMLGDKTHVKMQGSSMSSPHVAGIAALMLERTTA